MTVHFIGAGPGAADLLTLRAVKYLNESAVCLYAGTYIGPEVLAHCPPEVKLVDTQVMHLDDITAELVAAHNRGQDVARLCSGDPSIYSAIAEQTRRLDRQGVPWDVTPGVPAYAAAAALLGKELTVPEIAQTVILTRAHKSSTKMPDSESLALLVQSQATLVLHLAIRFVDELMATIEPSYGADCPVAVIANAEQPTQLILRGTVADIGGQVTSHGLRQAAIIIVGWALNAENFVESHLYGTRCARPTPIP